MSICQSVIYRIKKGNSILLSFNILQVQLNIYLQDRARNFFYLPIKEIIQSIFPCYRGGYVNDLHFLPYPSSKSQVNSYFAKASSLIKGLDLIFISAQLYLCSKSLFIFLNNFSKFMRVFGGKVNGIWSLKTLNTTLQWY